MFDFIETGPSIAYLFPGQGSQEVGMVKELSTVYPSARAALEEADDILQIPLTQLCFEGPEEVLTDTLNTQPALLAAGVAILRAIESELQSRANVSEQSSTQPRFVAGHSFGEYTALVAANSITYEDALKLARERGRLMKEAGKKSPGLMASVLGMGQEEVATICAEATAKTGIAQVANDNNPGQIVISGDQSGMDLAMQALKDAGARRVIPLAVSIAAHSPIMQPAAEELRVAIEATPIAAPTVPVIGNMSAQPLTTVEEITGELMSQLTGTVRWTETIQHAVSAGVTDFAEIGPGDKLMGMVKRIHRKTTRHSVNDADTVKKFVEQYWEESS